jgi:hypothetical protein
MSLMLESMVDSSRYTDGRSGGGAGAGAVSEGRRSPCWRASEGGRVCSAWGAGAEAEALSRACA